MKLQSRLAALLLLALALAGCGPVKFATPQEEATAQGWIARLRARDFDAISDAMDPSTKAGELRATLEKMADAFPPGAPTSTKLVGDNHVTSNDTRMVNLTYEYEFPGQWMLANVAIRSRAGVDSIVGFSAYRMPGSLEERNRFALADKPAICYLVLALAIGVPAFTIFALVVCARTKLRGRKWPWIIAILLGVGRLSVDWASGQWGFQPLIVQLLGAGAVAAPFGPWILSVSLPLGALVFLVRRESLKSADVPPLLEPAAAVE